MFVKNIIESIKIWPPFSPWNGQQDHLKIIKSGGCWSYVGMNGGEQLISLNGDLDPSTPGCWWKHTIVHEFIHAFGFAHEQQRPDRDDYVKVIWQNIPEFFLKLGDSVEYSLLRTSAVDSYRGRVGESYHFLEAESLTDTNDDAKNIYPTRL